MRHRIFLGLAATCVIVASSGTATAASPTGTHNSATSAPGFDLYCAHSLLGNLVIPAKVTGSLAPARPAKGAKFMVKHVQEQITLVSGLAKALVGMSPLHGKASVSLDTTGAAPATKATPSYSFVIVIPKSTPTPAVPTKVPASPAGAIGPFTATSSTVTVREDQTERIGIYLEPKGQPVPLDCVSFPPSAIHTLPGEPWAGANEPPLSKAIRPLIATG